MGDGKGKSGSHRSQEGGDREDGVVPRRRGRPSRPVSVAVSYRPRTEEEENAINEAIRLMLREMVRRRMASI